MENGNSDKNVENGVQEEERKIRHTISAEETFTLAKDIYDIRTAIKNVYENRAIIRRRVNIVTLCVSAIFTIFYLAYLIVSALDKHAPLVNEIVVYCIIGAYCLFVALLIIFVALSARATTKNMRKFTVALKVFRLMARLLSIAISIAAIAMTSPEAGSVSYAFKVIIIVLSILTLIVQIIPLFFGGIAKFCRWLVSPVRIKYRFSAVAVEWFELARKGEPMKGSSSRVDKKYFDKIGEIIDGTLVPEFGDKYINTIKAQQILELVENSPEDGRSVLEGVLKSIFAYAAECGYVVFDPCRSLNFEGTVEAPKHKTVKERLFGMVAKSGKKALDKYINSSSATTDDD